MTPVQPSLIEQKYAGLEGIPLPIAVYFKAFTEITFEPYLLLFDSRDPDDFLDNSRRQTATILNQ